MDHSVTNIMEAADLTRVENVFLCCWKIEVNFWKSSGFTNFRLPCENKSAIFQSTLTPFALFPSFYERFSWQMHLIWRVWGRRVRRIILQRKTLENSFKDFFSPHGGDIQSLTRSRVLFFLCHISQRSLWPQGVFM